MASIYASSSNQQVWWITPTGAIDGQVNTGKGWALPGTGPGVAYPFNQAGVASTANGGSMASVLLEGNNGLILFWVDPKGGVGYCRRSTSLGWLPISNALPPGTVNAASQLTTVCIGTNVYLFCVATDGSIVCGNWSDASSSSLGLMSQSIIALAGSAAPAGGLVSISVSAQEMAIFWVTPKNNIEIALLFPGASFRIIQKPLTIQQSVLAGTGIAVYSEEASQCSVWWIGQSNDLRRTAVVFTTVATTATPNWPVFEEVGPNSCRQTRSLVVQKVSGLHINLLYVNEKGTVAGLSYQSLNS